jgi:cell division septum initiation protein DivIVA
MMLLYFQKIISSSYVKILEKYNMKNSKVADISAFEGLQANANASMGAGSTSQMSVFNLSESKRKEASKILTDARILYAGIAGRYLQKARQFKGDEQSLMLIARDFRREMADVGGKMGDTLKRLSPDGKDADVARYVKEDFQLYEQCKNETPKKILAGIV